MIVQCLIGSVYKCTTKLHAQAQLMQQVKGQAAKIIASVVTFLNSTHQKTFQESTES